MVQIGTSGGFTPPGVPECPYEPRMTRAAALALRAAGGLRENCVVVLHTDTPTIGTAGSTSVTEIELNPVGPSEFGTTARVHTTFAASAFSGTYDIDLGTAGSITQLTDNWGNVVKDPDADSPTVHTQWPWHRGATNFRDNYVEDSTLTGWGTGVAAASRNRLISATVDLTGDWSFSDNTVQGGTVTLTQATGSRSFNGNTVRSAAQVRALAGATGNTFITDSQFLDGYVTEIAATSTAAVTLDGSVFTGHGSAALDCQIDGSGSRTINDTQSYAHGSQTQYVLVGAGAASVSTCVMNGARLVRDPATSATVSLGQVRGSGSIVQGPGATGGAISLSASTIEVLGTVITQNGPGAISSNTCRLAANISNTATATRGLTMTSCDLAGGVLSQGRTGGTGADTIQSLTLRASQSAVILQGATDPGGNQTPVNNVTVESGSSLNLTDPVGSGVGGSVCMQNCHLSANAIVAGTSTGLVSGCRFSAANVTLGAFSHDRTIVDGNGPVTFTAGNINRLHSKAYSDVI